MTGTSDLSAIAQKHTAVLQLAGYQTVFDICADGRTAFIRTLRGQISVEEARSVYRDARQRAAQLKTLYRAWQLRQEPVTGGLKKLASAPSAALHEALVRNIGGDGDFSDLIERSSEYADAASIQSLFSPGRYAAALYAAAIRLHDSGSALAIDTRRGDLKDLILSETTMNQEVSSLDILLEVLQAEPKNTLPGLAEAYFPMTLPYDDSLEQITAALAAQGRNLNGVWDTLADAQAQAFTPAEAGTLTSRAVRAASSEGGTFYLKAQGKMVYVTNDTLGNYVLAANLVLGEPYPHVKDSAVVALKLVRAADGKLYLGLSGSLNDFTHPLADVWLKGSNGQQNDRDGRFAVLTRAEGAKEGLNTNSHLAVTQEAQNDIIRLRTSRGYIGLSETGTGENLRNTLVLDAEKSDALTFTSSADEDGKAILPVVPLPPAPSLPPASPNPPTRTTLSLTPVSYQLMVNDALTESDIANHYGLSETSRSVGDLVTTLNVIDTFCEKTGLTFNQVLELTAQYSWDTSAAESQNRGRYQKYGQGSSGITTNKQYGANFLNSPNGSKNSLWVTPQAEGEPRLNLATSDNVTGLAGNAEKLIRLRNTTGLSFRELDWIIVNASRALGYETPTLDANVLRAIAAAVDLQQRYGLSPDTFTAFIGAVNPYAADQEKSLYETLFTSPDGTFTQPLSGTILANGDAGYVQQRAALCAATGVTDDELSRILKYCGLKTGDVFDEEVAGRILRFGAIARLLGITFAQMEALCRLTDGDIPLVRLGAPAGGGLPAIDLIASLEQVMAWVEENGLTLIQVQAMVSDNYSGTATAEMFTFLQNVYHSVNGNDPATRTGEMGDALRQKVLRALGGGFGVKTGVMAAVSDWLSAVAGVHLADYWTGIADFFTQENATVESLQQSAGDLVENTQRLSQLVLVARWLELSEQDLTVLTDHPEQLDATLSAVPSPDLPLLLLLTRFKRWQTQVTASRDEALRLLPLLADWTPDASAVVNTIATLHDYPADTVKAMSDLLFTVGKYPTDFAGLWQLLTWLRTGKTLNVGTPTLNDLLTMLRSDESAEEPILLARVASTLSAGLSR